MAVRHSPLITCNAHWSHAVRILAGRLGSQDAASEALHLAHNDAPYGVITEACTPALHIESNNDGTYSITEI